MLSLPWILSLYEEHLVGLKWNPSFQQPRFPALELLQHTNLLSEIKKQTAISGVSREGKRPPFSGPALKRPRVVPFLIQK